MRALFSFALILIASTAFQKAYAQLPIKESFKNSTAQDVVLGGTPNPAILTAGSGDPAGNGFLRLTNKDNDQRGFARSIGTFSSTNGVKVQFEYYAYEGDGPTVGADGFTFFLYNGNAVNSFQIGAFGGSLGYAQKFENGTINGVSKGFIAIGMDEYGNFANQFESRGSGVTTYPASAVVLRGSGDGYIDPISLPVDAAKNYEYITHIDTDDPASIGPNTFSLSGRKNPRNGGPLGGPLTPSTDGYRKVEMELSPVGPVGAPTGFNITVIIYENTGGTPTPTAHTVISNQLYTPDDGVPATLGYGFSASTGGFVSYHEIRNIKILASSQADPNAVKPFSKSGPKNTAIPFTASNFYLPLDDIDDDAASNFTDPNGDALSMIKITTAPSNGTLRLNGTPITLNVDIPYADLPNITYTPNSSTFVGSDVFQWNGSDGIAYSPASANVNITITPSPTVSVTNIVSCAPLSSTLPLSYTSAVDSPTQYRIVFGATALGAGFANVGVTALPASPNSVDVTIPNTAVLGTTYTADLYVRDVNGNEGPAIPFTIRVKPLAVAADISVAAPAAVCAGTNSTTITPTLSTPGSITSPVYTWYSNANRTGLITTGALTVNNLTTTTTYYVSVQGTEKCENAANTLQSVVVTVNSLPTATITYNSGNPYCKTGIGTVVRTGISGGTYSSTSGLSINTTTGEIDLAASTAGTYTVTYSFTNGTCANTTTTSVTINALPAAISGDASTAVGTSKTYTNATSGGTWSSDNTAVATIDPTSGQINGISAGTAVITYTVTATGCIATKTITITATPGGNNPPVVDVITKNGLKDTAVPFSIADFADSPRYQDPENVALVKVKISNLPPVLQGKLKLNTADITEGQEIDRADLLKITFVPYPGFTGDVSFDWNGSDGVNYATTASKVNIKISATNNPPVAQADGFTVVKGGTKIVSASDGVLKNDSDPDGNAITAIKVTNPANGTVTLNSDGSFVYVHNGGTSTSDSFTYKVNDGIVDGNTVTVNLTISATDAPPVVYDFGITMTGYTPYVFKTTDFSNINQYKDPELAPLSKIRITALPLSGVLKFNGTAVIVGREIPADQIGGLTYEAPLNPGGTVSFGWNGHDGTQYALAPAKVNISFTATGDPTAKIGLAKNLASVKPALNGTYDVKFVFTAVNYGLNALERISLKDNLSQAFGGAEATVKTVTAFGNLKVNPLYNGSSDTELLLPTSRLSAGEEAMVEMLVNIKLQLSSGLFQNTATAEGYSTISGLKVTDVSTNGLKPDPLVSNDVTPSDATPIQLDVQPLYSPQGFSPNGDGVNDAFVIQNAQGKLVALEVYNRWGNRVYKSADYKNDWTGQVTEGFFLGRDIPDGTYYYVIVIENKDKYVGFITINR